MPPLNQQSISAVITVRNNASQGIHSVNQEFQQLYEIVRNNWWGIQNIGVALGAMGGAVAAGFGMAVQAAVAFEDGMAGVARTTQDARLGTEEQAAATAKLAEQLREVARTRPVEIGRILGIAEEAGALGVAAEDVAQFTAVIVDLVATTNLTDAAATQLAKIAGVLDVPAAQFDNLGSSILAVGINMAATEDQIVNIARRIAPTAAIARFTAGEVIGLAGAILSLGPNAEAGGTAAQKTINDMAMAVAEAGDELTLFATLAGVSRQEFANIFAGSGAEAFALFVEGLSDAGSNAVEATQILNELGITEARQQTALRALAAGVKNSSNEYLSLRNAMQLGNDEFVKNTAVMDASQRRYETVQSQIKILRNNFVDLGIRLGTEFLPVINSVIDLIDGLRLTFESMPPGMQHVLVGFTGIAGALLLAAAAFALIGPRIVLARDAWQKLTGVVGANALVTRNAALAQIGATTKSAGSALRAGMAFQAMSAAQRAAAVEAYSLANASNTAAAGMGRAATASYMLGRGLAFARRAGGPLISLLLLLLPLIAMYKSAVDGVQMSSSRLAEIQGGFAEAFERQRRGTKGAVADFIKLRLETAASANELANWDTSMQRAMAVANNTASAQEFNKFLHEMTEAMESGDKRAANFYNTVAALRDATAGMAGAMRGAAEEVGDVGEEAAKSKQELNDLKRANDAVNQALLSLPGAMLAQRQANLSLQDAIEAYNDALRANARNLEAIQSAEHDLARARFDQEGAVEDLRAAERELADARELGLAELADAEDDYADAISKSYDIQAKVLELEQELAEVRNGPSLYELRDATNKLTEANHNLRDSQQEVEDAQWMLNYLMAEGASARDIQEARDAIADAELDVAKATNEVIDAQTEMNELTTGHPERVARLERELADARREAAKNVRDLEAAEKELARVRDRISKDRYYIEAQRRLAEAQMAAREASWRTRDAVEALRKAQSKTQGARDLAQAQLAVEEAYLRVAEANVDVRKQLALSRGEQFGAGREARALSDELGKLGRQAGGTIRADFDRFRGYLSNARADIDDTKNSTDDLIASLGGLGGAFDQESFEDSFAPLPQIADEIFSEAGNKAGEGFLDGVESFARDNLPNWYLNFLAFQGSLVKSYAKRGLKFWKSAYSVGGNLLEAIGEGVSDGLDNFSKAVGDLFGDVFDRSGKRDAPGWGGSLGGGIIKGFGEFMLRRFTLGGLMQSLFGREKPKGEEGGKNYGKAIAGSIGSGIGTFFKNFSLAGIITNLFASGNTAGARQAATYAGAAIAGALQYGMVTIIGGIGGRGGLGGVLFTLLQTAFKALPESLKTPLNDIVRKLNGFFAAIGKIAGLPIPGLATGILKGIGAIRLPEFASGGVATKATMGVFGEAGAEALIPLDQFANLFAPINLLAMEMRATNEALSALIGTTTAGASTTNYGGDTFYIERGDKDALELADEMAWRKTIRST